MALGEIFQSCRFFSRKGLLLGFRTDTQILRLYLETGRNRFLSGVIQLEISALTWFTSRSFIGNNKSA